MKIIELTEIPIVEPGDDLPGYVCDSLENQGLEVEDGDVLVLAQSVVSKAEGNIVDLNSVDVGERAEEISGDIGEDPRKVQVILEETGEIVRQEHVLISRTKHGFVCADAGVDGSNVEGDRVTVLPDDPDESAEEIRSRISSYFDRRVATIVTDSWGRPFRLGAVGFAIGVAGVEPLADLRGRRDIYGNELKTTILCPVDAISAAASLVMGEAGKGVPAVLVKDAPLSYGDGSISDLVRDKEKDLFR